MGVCVGISASECRGQRHWVSPTARVTGDFKLPNVGVGNQTWVLCRSCTLSSSVCHPHFCICGGLNDSGPHRLKYLDVWSLLGGTIWEGLWSVALLEEVCHGDGSWGFKSPSHSQLALLLPLACPSGYKLPATASEPRLPVCYHSLCHNGHVLTFWNCKPPINFFFFSGCVLS